MQSQTTMSIDQKDTELNEKILRGEALQAFEEFYADDVVMRDQDLGPWEGKDTNRAREKDFFSKVTELRDIRLKQSIVGDDVTMSVWHYDYTHEDWGDQKYDQVAVRHWNDEGLIEKERFFRG